VALGGEVARNQRGQQIGVLDVGWRPDAAEDPLFAAVAGPARAVQWNNDIVVELPDDAVLLAETPRGGVQAVRFAPTVWGVQWHPEAGGDIVGVWADDDRDDAIERGIDVYEVLQHVRDAEPELRATWRPLVESFVAGVRSRTPTAP
jgi:GMP synthase (glutamine-hydrolysing)